MKRILSLTIIMCIVILLQVLINVYIPDIHLDLLGLTILAVWISHAKVPGVIILLLSLLADIVGQYYFGTHMLLFTFVLIFVKKYSLYLCLCERFKKITYLQSIGLVYYLSLSVLNFFLQHVMISFTSILFTVILMPIIYYHICKIFEQETIY